MKIQFVIVDPNLKFYQYKKWEHDFPAIPRVGEHVVRHVEGELSLQNRFIVKQVYYVAETRERYLNSPDLWSPIVIELARVNQ